MIKSFDSSVEAYRLTCKDTDRIYSSFAKNCGLSDAEYWMMWMISEGKNTQTAISEGLFISKQTVNSACRQLEKKGMVKLEVEEGNLRTKKITFTAYGNDFVQKNFDVLDRAEERVWKKLGENERMMLVSVSQKYNGLLKAEINSLENKN